MTFNNVEEIKAYVLSQNKIAIEKARDDVYKIIHDVLVKFYDEYQPDVYERTYQLLCSLVKTEVKCVGRECYAEIYFDASQLDYQTKMLHLSPYNGGYINPFNNAYSSDGVFPNTFHRGKVEEKKILETAMEGANPHGGYPTASNTAIWIEAMSILSVEGMNILKARLREFNVPVK